MEKFIQEILVVFVVITAGVILFYAFIFLFWILLIAIGIALVYRIIKYIIGLFISKKPDIIENNDL